MEVLRTSLLVLHWTPLIVNSFVTECEAGTVQNEQKIVSTISKESTFLPLPWGPLKSEP